MKVKFAKINWLDGSVEIRSGKKGTGKVLFYCSFCKEHTVSVWNAETWLDDEARKLTEKGYIVIKK